MHVANMHISELIRLCWFPREVSCADSRESSSALPCCAVPSPFRKPFPVWRGEKVKENELPFEAWITAVMLSLIHARQRPMFQRYSFTKTKIQSCRGFKLSFGGFFRLRKGRTYASPIPLWFDWDFAKATPSRIRHSNVASLGDLVNPFSFNVPC